MKRFTLMLVALGAFGLVTSGCKKENTEEAPAAEEAAKPAEGEVVPTEEPAEEVEAMGEEVADEAEEAAAGAEAAMEEAGAEGETAETGVAECDELIEKYTACVNEKAPAEVREETLEAFQANVQAWQKAAQDESAKQALAEGCTQTTEQLKKSSEAWGCEW